MIVHIVSNNISNFILQIPECGSNVLDLKKAIKRHFELQQIRKKDKTKISWKYIWRTYHLQLENRDLDNDKILLKDYGLRNYSQVNFIKKRRLKNIR